MWRQQNLHGRKAAFQNESLVDTSAYSHPVVANADESKHWLATVREYEKQGQIANCVKSPAIWAKAKAAAGKSYDPDKDSDAYYGSAMEIYKNEGGKLK